jgi:hypothetical protein
VWDATSFTKNRDGVLNEAMAQAFLSALLGDPKVKRLLSQEHFTVDGTLLKAWAGMKSFRRKDGKDDPPGGGPNAERDFRGEKRSNQAHASTTDPDARPYRKGNGQESRLCCLGHVLMENRHAAQTCLFSLSSPAGDPAHPHFTAPRPSQGATRRTPYTTKT